MGELVAAQGVGADQLREARVMMRGGVYWAWFVPSLIKNLVTIIPKAAVLYVLFQALLPILQRMDLIPKQVDGAIKVF